MLKQVWGQKANDIGQILGPCKEKKSIGERINESKIKFLFLLLLIDLKDNYLINDYVLRDVSITVA